MCIRDRLEEYGFEYSYGGTIDNGFYLRRITRSDAFIGDGIPENLRSKIELDEIPFNSQYSYDSLGEFDYTMASGWMYRCV